jgi:hypothetical protein
VRMISPDGGSATSGFAANGDSQQFGTDCAQAAGLR